MMNSTIKDIVLDVISGYSGLGGITNKDVAEYTGIPEPSVRRATRRLYEDGKIFTGWGNRFNATIWSVNQPGTTVGA